MNLHWHLEKSRYAVVIAMIIAIVPSLLSLVLTLSDATQLILNIQAPITFWLLHNELVSHIGKQYRRLSWANGIWSIGDDIIYHQGCQTNNSFSLGLLHYLSIKGDNEKRIEFWLFPDSLKNNREDWRHLQACFHLSKQANQDK